MKKKSRMIFIGILLVTGVLGLTLVSFAETVTYTYDSLGRLRQVDYGNGVIIKHRGHRGQAATFNKAVNDRAESRGADVL